MPRYNPSDDEMDASYAGPPAEESPATEETEPVDQEVAEGNTTIVPNNILSPDGEPIKEGDEIVVRVVKNYGDESEIEYAPKEGATEEEMPEEPMATERAELTALSGEGVE